MSKITNEILREQVLESFAFNSQNKKEISKLEGDIYE